MSPQIFPAPNNCFNWKYFGNKINENENKKHFNRFGLYHLIFSITFLKHKNINRPVTCMCTATGYCKIISN